MAEQITKSRLRRSLTKRDKYGAEISPGDVCVWGSKAGAIICVYAGNAPGGKTGLYGSFHTPIGIKSIAYKNIVIAYDPMGSGERVSHDIAKRLLRNYYG